MSSSEKRKTLPSAPIPVYVYRKKLSPVELAPAIGAGLAVGVVTFYVAKLFLERTPLLPAKKVRTKADLPARAAG